MPSQTLIHIAGECGIDIEAVEKHWQRHEKDLKAEGRSPWDQDFWPMLVTRTRKTVGAACSKKMGWKEEGQKLSKARSGLLRHIVLEYAHEQSK